MASWPTTGADYINGTAGADTIDALSGHDTVNGLGGDDRLEGGSGSDTLNGGDGNDILTDSGTEGAWNELSGDAGDDTLTVSSGPARLNGGIGADTLVMGGTASGTLYGGASNDSLIGGDGIDWLSGEAGADTLTGGAGADVFEGWQWDMNGDVITDYQHGEKIRFMGGLSETAVAVLEFDGANTLLKIDSYGDGVFETTITLSGQVTGNVVITQDYMANDTIRIVPVEGMGEPTSFNDFIAGTTDADSLDGAGGYDTILGLAGDDTIYGGADHDTLDGGEGNDILDGGFGYDTIRGGAGDDYINDTGDDQQGGWNYGGAGADTIIGSSGYTTLEGEDGDDVLTFTGSGYGAAFGGAGMDLLQGGDGEDYLDGGADADQIAGGAGQDMFTGYSWEMNGDVITDYQFGEQITFIDALSSASSVWMVSSGTDAYINIDADGDGIAESTLTLLGAGQGSLSVSQDHDGQDVLRVVAPSQVIYGTEFDDLIETGEGSHIVYGLGGSDQITTLGGADRLEGGDGEDRLDAGAGIDVLLGGGGFDLLRGGEGADLITGGADQDTYVGFTYELHGDQITDFEFGEQIWLGENLVSPYGVWLETVDNDALLFIDHDYDGYVDAVLTLTGAAGGELQVESIFGGENNLLRVVAPPNVITGTEGDDLLEGTFGRDIIFGLGGMDILAGGWDADTLTGGEGEDLFAGYAGELNGDVITDYQYGELINIGDYLFDPSAFWMETVGDDALIHIDTTGDGVADSVFTLIGAGAGTLEVFSSSEWGPLSFMHVLAPDNVVTGTEEADILEGTNGRDIVEGLGGDDHIFGGDADDQLSGGAGMDLIWGGWGADVVSGGEGEDVFYGYVEELNGDVITDYQYGEQIRLGDYLFYPPAAWMETSGADALVFIDTTGDGVAESVFTLTGAGAGVLEVTSDYWGGSWILRVINPGSGTPSDDFITGTEADDVIDAGGGYDYVEGLGGNDKLAGGDGDDVLEGGDGADLLDGGEGNDVLRGGEGNDSLFDYGEGVWSEQNGGGGNDTLVVASGYGLLFGAEGDDFLSFADGSAEGELYGGVGADVLQGGFGMDLLKGGDGADLLAGGLGLDTFAGTLEELSLDHVVDYELGEAFVIHGLSAGQAQFQLIDSGPNSTLWIDPAGNGQFQLLLTFEHEVHGRLQVEADANDTTLRIVSSAGVANQAPTGANNTVSMVEGTDVVLTFADFGFSDQDGDSLLAIHIVTLPSSGTLFRHWLPVGAGDIITFDDLVNGNVVYSYEGNVAGQTADGFSFAVQDSGGTAAGGTDLGPQNTMTFDIEPTNDAPVVEQELQLITTAEDASSGHVLIGAQDPDGDALAFSLFHQPEHGQVTFTDAGFVYTPDADFNGVDAFGILISDGELFATQTVSVTVTPVNDAPVSPTPLPDLHVMQGQSLSIDVAQFTDADGQALTYSGVLPDGLSLSADGLITGSLSGAQDLVSVTVTASDGAASASDTFDIYVGRNYTGSAGADSYLGGRGNDRIDGGKGNDTLGGAAGDDFIRGGLGNDVLTGGEGADLFAFGLKAGSDKVMDMQIGIDHLLLEEGVRATGWNVSKGNTVISLSGGGSITLVGVSEMDAATFADLFG